MNSFELARGYTPALVSLPQAKVPSQLLIFHNEQMARRALSLFQKLRVLNILTTEDLSKKDIVHFFKRSAKFGEWEVVYVRDCHPHFAVLSRRQDHAGKPIRAAYEDICKAATSPLLQELDRIEFIFVRSYSAVHEDYEESDCLSYRTYRKYIHSRREMGPVTHSHCQEKRLITHLNRFLRCQLLKQTMISILKRNGLSRSPTHLPLIESHIERL